MNQFQRQNMIKHIKFLRDNADIIRKDFDMRNIQNPNYIGCGTPACSLGWASVSVGLDPFKENESFWFFGINDKVGEDTSAWGYCFGFDWAYANNTPEAAAARMEAVLYNQVPKDWDYATEFAHPIVNIPEAKKLFKPECV